MTEILKVVLATILVAAATVALVIYSGIYNVAADEAHWPLTRWILDTAAARSVAVRQDEVLVPDNLGGEEQMMRGAVMYGQVCAGCHLGPGIEPTPMNRGMKPMPPSLAEHVPHHSAANIFWIVKHGIKMSGMPALGASFTDDELWDVVSFVNTLPDLEPEEYQRRTNARSINQQ